MIIFGLFFTIVSSAIYFFYGNKERVIKKISIQCEENSNQERQQCFEKEILAYLNEKPEATKDVLGALWGLLEKGELSDDARMFSPLAHSIGMLFIGKGIPFREAVKLCSLDFRAGCVHGVFMEHIDLNHKEVSMRSLLQECLLLVNKDDRDSDIIFKNCIHGAGHELVAKTKTGLNETLFMCNELGGSLKGQCLYGVFMEYSKGEAGGGHHSEMPVGRKSYDCLGVDDAFREICYTSLGFYKQYEADSESWEETYIFCNNLPKEGRKDCINGTGGALLFSHAFVIKDVVAECESLPDSVRLDCLSSF